MIGDVFLVVWEGELAQAPSPKISGTMKRRHLEPNSTMVLKHNTDKTSVKL